MPLKHRLNFLFTVSAVSCHSFPLRYFKCMVLTRETTSIYRALKSATRSLYFSVDANYGMSNRNGSQKKKIDNKRDWEDFQFPNIDIQGEVGLTLSEVIYLPEWQNKPPVTNT